MNDTVRAALITVIKGNRRKLSKQERKKGIKPQRWLYPAATESRYATTIRSWFKPMKTFVQNYLKENQEAIMRGDSVDRADDISVMRLDAVPGKSFKNMIDALNGWQGQYVPEDDESKSGSPLYTGLGKIAESLFDFNEGQYEKGAKATLGVEFPSNEEWWPDARETWSDRNYDIIRSDLQKYIGQVNELTEQAVTTGKSVKELSKQIMGLDDKFTKGRAKFIARDQIGKLNGQVTQRRMEDAGLSMYIWETAGDERVRDSHEYLDGMLCQWDDSSVYSDDDGKTWKDRPSSWCQLHPGMDYQCRCSAVAYWQELVGEADALIDDDEDPSWTDAFSASAKEEPARIEATGARSTGALIDKPEGERQKYAETYYKSIRNRKSRSDIKAISQNTGFSEEIVEKIRDHIFTDEHDMGDGTIGRFNEDWRTAQAWQRLEQGKGTALDILLMNHELEELTLMREGGYNYIEAHAMANSKFDWWKAYKEQNKE